MGNFHPRRKVSSRQLEREPYILWNKFVDLLAMSDYDVLTPVQRIAHLAFWYDSEIQNGGHLQYFENQGTAHLDETIAALKCLGAECQSTILSRAKTCYLSKPRKKIESVSEYVEAAL